MALFRLICVKFSQFVYGGTAAMSEIHLWLQHGLVASHLIAYYFAYQYYGSSNLHEFCHGYTTEVCIIVYECESVSVTEQQAG